jgi:transcriptional regulator with XRE-family HTH domain
MPTDKTNQITYDYTAFAKELGKRIKHIRQERGLTLRTLIVQHDYHLTQIQRIEAGEGLSVPTLLRLASTFQIPLETLVAGLGRTPTKESPTKPVKPKVKRSSKVKPRTT